MGLSKQYNLSLFVHKIGKETANLMVKRYYQESEKYKAIKSDSVGHIRQCVADIERQTKDLVHKIGNPGRIMFEHENELLICLKIQEPDVTATLPLDDSFNQPGVIDSVQILQQIQSSIDKQKVLSS